MISKVIASALLLIAGSAQPGVGSDDRPGRSCNVIASVASHGKLSVFLVFTCSGYEPYVGFAVSVTFHGERGWRRPVAVRHFWSHIRAKRPGTVRGGRCSRAQRYRVAVSCEANIKGRTRFRVLIGLSRAAFCKTRVVVGQYSNPPDRDPSIPPLPKVEVFKRYNDFPRGCRT